MPVTEFCNLEAEVSGLKTRSQRVQEELTKVRKAQHEGRVDLVFAFERAAKAILDPRTFAQIQLAAAQLIAADKVGDGHGN